MTRFKHAIHQAGTRIFSLDLRGLAFFRICIAIILFLDVTDRFSDLRAHYTQDGILPLGVYLQHFSNSYFVSLFFANDRAFWPAILFSVMLGLAILLMVGYRTRIVTVCIWLLIIFVHNRNPMILSGADVLFRVLLFWAMFLPLGAVYSVDAALKKPVDIQPNASSRFQFASAGTFALVIQVGLIYLSTSLFKTGNEWWPDGTASYFALALDQFTTPFGTWMAKQYSLLQLGTYFVYFLEISAFFLLLVPIWWVRIGIVALLVFMHFNFFLTMYLGLFPWIDIAVLLALLPPKFWDLLEQFVTSRQLKQGRFLVCYDGDCRFCEKMVRLLQTFSMSPFDYKKAQDEPVANQIMAKENSWVIILADGKTLIRGEALIYVFKRSPVLWWFGAFLTLAPCRFILDRIYRWVAGHRGLLGRFTSRFLPFHTRSLTKTSIFGQYLALFFIGYILVWNMTTIPRFEVSMIPAWTRIANFTRVDQMWNMFAPFPLKTDGWYVIPGKLQDGSEVDVFKGMKLHPVSWEKPADVAGTYKNSRWRKYMMNIWMKKYKDYRLYYGRYVCRNWNQTYSGAKQLQTFEITYMKEVTPAPGEKPTPEKVVIWRHDCFKKS